MIPFFESAYVREYRVWFFPITVIAFKKPFWQLLEKPASMAGPIPSLASFFLANTESRLPIGAPCRPQAPLESPQNSPTVVIWALEQRNKAVLLSKTVEREAPLPRSPSIPYNGALREPHYAKLRDLSL